MEIDLTASDALSSIEKTYKAPELEGWIDIRFYRKIGIAREQPTAMAPRSDRIGVEPAPESRAADRRHDAARDHFALQLPQRPARQRDADRAGTFTRETLDLNDDAGGKSGLCARLAALRPTPPGVGRRTVSAIY